MSLALWSTNLPECVCELFTCLCAKVEVSLHIHLWWAGHGRISGWVHLCESRAPKRISVSCKNCPLENGAAPGSCSCKGHLVRKFIKKCWSKFKFKPYCSAWHQLQPTSQVHSIIILFKFNRAILFKLPCYVFFSCMIFIIAFSFVWIFCSFN